MSKVVKRKNIKKVILAILLICIVFLLIVISSNINKNEKLKQIALGENNEKVYNPNEPMLSAGMIPIKRKGDNWIIASKDDQSWYNYEAGKPAYIMLNNGTYQSEIITDMTNKKLASEHIGENVSISDAGSIYLWIPRFAINSDERIKYIPAGMQLGGDWDVPDMFIYPVEDETKPDYSLTGIWISNETNTNYANIITKMQEENGIYGFLANTKARKINEYDMDNLQKYSDFFSNTGESFPATITNTNRIILQIIQTNLVEPIKAKAFYDKEADIIKIEITYHKNEIIEILDDESGNELDFEAIEQKVYANTGNKLLEEPTYTFTVVDSLENKVKVCANGIIPNYYGKKVTNYNCPIDTDNEITWRIFHKDKENIYLIADDYIPYELLPKSQEGNTLKAIANYTNRANFSTVHDDYTGSEWIIQNTSEQIQKWINKFTNSYPKSTNSNIQSTAYMMDIYAWRDFLGGQAEYVIGGPTIQLYCASYKVTHPNKYIECDSINYNGYSIKLNTNTSYSDSLSGLKKDEYNGIYIKGATDKANGMWIASPSSRNYYNYLLCANNSGTIDYATCYSDNNYGLRPIVCLNSETVLQKNPEVEGEEVTYSIGCPIEAIAIYNDNDERIEIEVISAPKGIRVILDEDENPMELSKVNGKTLANTGTKKLYEGIHTFTIIDNDGNKKKLNVKIERKVYATYYTDGTLAFSSDNSKIEEKTIGASYGNISGSTYTEYHAIPWYGQINNIKTVQIVNKIFPKSTAMWFYNCSKLETIDGLEKLKTKHTLDMSNMFYSCTGLTMLNIDNFDTSSVTNMSNMFYGCTGLTNLNANFDTNNVTDMSYMFYGCTGITTLNINNFDTSNVVNMSNMFFNCKELTELDVSKFNTSNVTDMSYMFCNCEKLEHLNVSKFKTSNVENMKLMFGFCEKLTSIDVSDFNTNKVTDMNGMFLYCKGVTGLDVSGFNTSNVTDMSSMFCNCENLEHLNVSNFNTSNVENMRTMFCDCSKLTELYIANFNTAKVTNMQEMFEDCSSLTSLDLSSFNTSNVKSMREMFWRCNSLVELDLSSWNNNNSNTENLEDMQYMFLGCENLSKLDLSNFKTGNVTNMLGTFEGCSNLTTLDVSSFDTSKVTCFQTTFRQCEKLKELDLRNFNTGKATDMSMMFSFCKNLDVIYVGRYWSTARNSGGIFYECKVQSVTKL